MTARDILLHHLEYTFEKEAWQPALAMAVEGLNAQQAAWKPAPGRHSIWQIVRHIIHWKRATLGAWDGTTPVYRAGTGPTQYGFELERTDWPEVTGDDASWHRDLGTLQDVSQAVRQRVTAMDEADLLAPFPGEEMPSVLRLLRMATHDIYHAGQIRYLRALQGV